MGIDLNQIFGDAQQAAQQGMNDILQTGGNSALGFLEGKAADIISADAASKQAAAQAATTAILNRPTAAGSFGAYLSNMVQSPILKQYGGEMVIGVVAIGVFALLIFRR